jgi:hypothetical protein
LHEGLEIVDLLLLDNFLYTLTIKKTYKKAAKDKALEHGIGLIDMNVYKVQPKHEPKI